MTDLMIAYDNAVPSRLARILCVFLVVCETACESRTIDPDLAESTTADIYEDSFSDKQSGTWAQDEHTDIYYDPSSTDKVEIELDIGRQRTEGLATESAIHDSSVDAHHDVADTEVCVPKCEGKQCGPDGCGGTCGQCPNSKPICDPNGKCKKCKPNCVAKECGSDGCGGVCGMCPKGWTCKSGKCIPPECSENQVVYSELFNSCSLTPWQQIDEQPQDGVQWNVAEINYVSPPCAVYLGNAQTGSYYTGDVVTVALVSPQIFIPVGPPLRLVFSVWIDAEPVVAPQYPYNFDVLRLFIVASDQGPAQEVEVFNSKQFLNNTQQEWVNVAINLFEFQGMSIQLKFLFDTIDSADNNYGGIYLDNIVIDTICPFCSSDSDCSDSQPCTQDFCTLFSNEQNYGTCTHLPIVDCCVGKEENYCDDGDECTIDECDEETGLCTHEDSNSPDCSTG